MKIAAMFGYVIGFLFIGVCALMTAQINEDTQPARKEGQTPQTGQVGGPMSPGMFRGGGMFSIDDYFASRDGDGDGKLTLEEMSAGRTWDDSRWSGFRQRMFESQDTDKDGLVS